VRYLDSRETGFSGRRMSGRRTGEVVALQQSTSQVRNICILAHVDHGKTSLSDCLVSSNGIISERLAGSVRYLDSREDEQDRGITMQSSAISLVYRHERLEKDYLINLIDSPGHVDFSSDVSTAVRLCDGALVVVDVIEGVAIQTHAVLRQAWEERLRPCLVLNKVDRLITELHLDPVEAYEHLSKIIERVNAILQGFVSASVMGDAFKKGSASKSGEGETLNSEQGQEENNLNFALEFDEEEEEALIFSPEKGNVAFASAVDNWAFRVIDFVPLVAELIDQPHKKVLQSCWGGHSYNAKTKKIVSQKQIEASTTTGESSRKYPPMFASFILESIWQIYGATVLDSKPKKLEKMIARLGLSEKVNKREVAKGGKPALKSVMHAWLPVTRALLSMVVRWVPNPSLAQQRRIEVLWPREQLIRNPELTDELTKTYESIKTCDPEGPLVVYVTKLFAEERKALDPATIRRLEQFYEETDLASKPLGGEEAVGKQGNTDDCDGNGERKEFFFAFARVFSGTLRPGVPVHVLGPKYVPDQTQDTSHHRSFVSFGVIPMLIMGSDLAALDQVPAGNVLAIAGLERDVLKTATVSTTHICCSLSKMPTQSAPILRVSLEPANPVDWPQLSKGLRLLNRADPVVEVKVQPNGEHILGAIGELHLERCVKDLTERFAGIELKVSKPIAIFRETLVIQPPGDDGKSPHVPSPCDKMEPISLAKEEEDLLRAASLAEAAVDPEGAANLDEEEEEDSNKNETGPAGHKAGPTSPLKPVPLSKKVFSGGRVLATIGNNHVAVSIRTIPLPKVIVSALEECRPSLTRLVDDVAQDDGEEGEGENTGPERSYGRRRTSRRSSRRSSRKNSIDEEQQDLSEQKALEQLRSEVRSKLEAAFREAGPGWAENKSFERIWSLGPRGVGANVLFNMTEACPVKDLRFDALTSPDQAAVILEEENDAEVENSITEAEESGGSAILWDEIATGVVAGFQLACRQGPLCEEPLWGVATVIDQVLVKPDRSLAEKAAQKSVYVAGQVMSSVRDGIRRAFNAHHEQHEHGTSTGCQVRLAQGFLKCSLQCHVESHQGDQLGKMYGVLSKRHAKILSEDMLEGTSIFTIEALIPVVESFSLGDDLRSQTSGAASTPQLQFSHWEIIAENPFFRPTTEDELEEFGETGYEESYLLHNRAHKYIEEVRKRKGLATKEKVILEAEKQRTISRKK